MSRDAAGRTERLDVLLLGLALPRRHGRARVVLDHGAQVTCGRFRVSRTSRGWLGVPAAVLQRALGFGSVCMPGASVRVFFQVHIGSSSAAAARVLPRKCCWVPSACGPLTCTKKLSQARVDLANTFGYSVFEKAGCAFVVPALLLTSETPPNYARRGPLPQKLGLLRAC